MREPQPFESARAMVELAARALGRIDRDGIRGLTGLSVDEIAAMAGILAAAGLVAIPPGAPAPADLLVPPAQPQKEA